MSRDCEAAGSLQVVNIGSPVALVEEIGKGSLRWSEPEEFAELPLVRTSGRAQGFVRSSFDCGGLAGEERGGGHVGECGVVALGRGW